MFPNRDHLYGWYESAAYREILPLRTENSDGVVIFVEGVDLDKQAMRTFRLDRIEAVEPSAAPWPESLPPHERAVAGTAEVLATPAAAAMLADYATSAPVEVDGGRVRLEIEVWSEASVLRAVAGCGGDAEVIAPASLRDAMQRFADDALQAGSSQA